MANASQFSVAITATDRYSEAFKGFVKNVRGHFGEIEKAGKETGEGETMSPVVRRLQ